MAYAWTEDYSTSFSDSHERRRSILSYNWSGDSIVHGSDSGPDLIKGFGGEDRIYSHGGNDRIEGGADDDILVLGAGNDIGRGGDGDDIIYGDFDNSINIRTKVKQVRAITTTADDDRDEIYFFSYGYTNSFDTLYQGRISPFKDNNDENYYNGDDYYGMHDHPDSRDPNVRFDIGLGELNLRPGEKAFQIYLLMEQDGADVAKIIADALSGVAALFNTIGKIFTGDVASVPKDVSEILNSVSSIVGEASKDNHDSIGSFAILTENVDGIISSTTFTITDGELVCRPGNTC